MKINILALGSTGDIAPCAALGGGLAQAGHHVRLVTFEHFRGVAERNHMAFAPVAGDVRAMLKAGGGNLARLLFQFFNQARQYARDFSAPEVMDADLILNQLPGGLYGWDLAEKLSIPMLALAYLPMLATSAYPMIGYPSLFSGIPGYNRLTYRLAEQMVWLFFRGSVNHWRREVLRLPAQPSAGHFHELGTLACPVVLGVSPALFPPQPDWAPVVHQTGYWYPQDADWQPSLALLKFINAGSPPLFVGFGSMSVPDPAAALQTILRALRQSGQRAVLHSGWAGMGESNLPDNVFRIDYAPYDWLFPRMAGLVIHGGAGSVHFALRSGKPTLVVPFLFDQFVWGRRFQEIGFGPAPLPFRRLNAERLAAAFQDLATSSVLANSAARLGEMVRQEPGIEGAVRIIEAI